MRFLKYALFKIWLALSMHKHVVVIGAGMAGMAAATILASRGIQTTLIEAAAHLGGRARSVAIEHERLQPGFWSLCLLG